MLLIIGLLSFIIASEYAAFLYSYIEGTILLKYLKFR